MWAIKQILKQLNIDLGTNSTYNCISMSFIISSKYILHASDPSCIVFKDKNIDGPKIKIFDTNIENYQEYREISGYTKKKNIADNIDISILDCINVMVYMENEETMVELFILLMMWR